MNEPITTASRFSSEMTLEKQLAWAPIGSEANEWPIVSIVSKNQQDTSLWSILRESLLTANGMYWPTVINKVINGKAMFLISPEAWSDPTSFEELQSQSDYILTVDESSNGSVSLILEWKRQREESAENGSFRFSYDQMKRFGWALSTLEGYPRIRILLEKQSWESTTQDLLSKMRDVVDGLFSELRMYRP